MINKIAFLSLFLLMLSAGASAAITVSNISPGMDANYLKGSDYNALFTVNDDNADASNITYIADITYSTNYGGTDNTIVTDLNLGNKYQATGHCASKIGGTDTTCQYDFDTTSIPDGNYFIDVNVQAFWFYDPTVEKKDQNTCSQGNADSAISFMIDNTAPIIQEPSLVPQDGADVNNASPVIEMDVNDFGTGLDLSVGTIKADGKTLNPSYDFNLFTFDNNKHAHLEWDLNWGISSGTTVTVDVNLFDALGNQRPFSWSFTVDTQAPSGHGVKINGTDEWCNSRDVDLTFTNSGDAVECRVRNDGGSWDDWFNKKNSESWKLKNSDGKRTVFFQCRDAAGNWSSSVNDTIKMDREKPEPVEDFEASYDEDDGEIKLEWKDDEYDDGSDDSGVDEYWIYRNEGDDDFGDSDTERIKRVNAGDDSYGDDDSDLDEGKTYYYWITAVDKAGNKSNESDEDSATFGEGGSNGTDSDDTENPTGSWFEPKNNSIVSGDVILEITASDNEEVDDVVFFIDGSPIHPDNIIREDNARGFYYIEWDSTSATNGRHSFKARIKDGAGNYGYTGLLHLDVNNGSSGGEGEEEEGEEENEAVSAAEEKKGQLDALFGLAEGFCIEASSEVQELLGEAQNLLDEANNLLDDGNVSGAEEKAGEAEALFEEVSEKFSVVDYGNKQAYEYNSEQLELFLKGTGMSQGLVEEAAGMLGEFPVERQLSFKKFKDCNDTHYKAVVTLEIENNSGERKEVQVVEVVPKEFAENASDLDSSNAFTVIAADPVIEWNLELEAGESKTVNYVLKENLDEGKANEMLEAEAVQVFVAPPIVLDADTELSEASFNAALTGAGTGLFGLGNALNWIGWIVIALVVAAVALLAFNYLQQGKGETPTGLGAVGKRESILDTLTERISEMSKGDKGKEGPRWAYKD